jgi:hypothetical protein
MTDRLRLLGVLPLLSLMAGSCTCHRDLPPTPAPSAKHTGFNAALPTPKASPKKQVAQVPTRVQPTPAPVVTPTVGKAELPEDFPKDIPIMKGFEPIAVQDLAGNAKNVLFQTDAEPTVIYQEYRGDMQTKGWNVTQEYEGKDQSFLSFKKGKTITNMTIARDPKTGKQIVAMMYYEEEDLPFPEF